MRLYADLNLILAGAQIFSAIQYLWIWHHGWRSAIPVFFAALCLTSGVNAITIVTMHTSGDPDTAHTAIRILASTQALNYMLLIWFVSHVVDWHVRWLEWSMTVVMVGVLVTNGISDISGSISQPMAHTLPWGETVSIVRLTQVPWWSPIVYLLVLITIGFTVMAGIRVLARDRITGVLVIAMGLVLVAGVSVRIAIDWLKEPLPYPGAFATVPWLTLGFLLVTREYTARGERLVSSEAQAQRAEARLRATIDAMPLLFWAQGRDGIFVLQNRRSRDAFGDTVGRHPHQVAPDAVSLARWMGRFDEAMQNRPTDEIINWMEHGEPRQVRVITAPITEADLPAGCVGMVIDQSAEHVALLKAREAETRFTAIFQHAPEAIVISRVADGRIVDANTSFERLVGWELKDAVGKSTVELGLFPDPQERERLRTEVLVQQGFLDGGTSLIRHKDGRAIDVLLSVRQITLRGEAHLVALIRDISDRLAMERELIEQRNRIVQAERLAKAGSMLLASRGELWWSEGLRTLHGLAMDTPLPRSLEGYLAHVHPDDRETVAAAARRIMRAEVIVGLRYRIMCGDQVHWLEVASARMSQDADGSGWNVQATVVDVTEREIVLRQIVSQEREAVIGRMAGRVAHEVNNPLEAIKALIEPLSRRSEGNPKVVEGLFVIDRQVDRIAKLVRGLLGLVRQRAQHRTQVHPAEILRTVADLFQPRFAKAGKNLILDLPGDLPHAVVDADQIQQVVINLIENALAAVPVNGSVRIAAGVTDKVLEVAVEDDGPGLGSDPERFFQPFFTTKSNGTGLGLSVARTICENHQGSLIGENRHPQGARFRMRLRTDLPSDRSPFIGTAINGGIVQV